MEDQLQLDDEVNSEIADGYTVGSSARHRTAVGDLPASSVSALQLVLRTLGSERTPPLTSYQLVQRFGPCVFHPRVRRVHWLLAQMALVSWLWLRRERRVRSQEDEFTRETLWRRRKYSLKGKGIWARIS